MKPLTAKWVEKAEEDWRAVLRECRARRGPSWSVVCFHCQQTVEKLAKALLTEDLIPFPKSHDLGDLLSRAAAARPALASFVTLAVSLNPFAVQIRYPGLVPSQSLAQSAVRTARNLRTTLRRELGLIRPRRRKKSRSPKRKK